MQYGTAGLRQYSPSSASNTQGGQAASVWLEDPDELLLIFRSIPSTRITYYCLWNQAGIGARSRGPAKIELTSPTIQRHKGYDMVPAGRPSLGSASSVLGWAEKCCSYWIWESQIKTQRPQVGKCAVEC